MEGRQLGVMFQGGAEKDLPIGRLSHDSPRAVKFSQQQDIQISHKKGIKKAPDHGQMPVLLRFLFQSDRTLFSRTFRWGRFRSGLLPVPRR